MTKTAYLLADLVCAALLLQHFPAGEYPSAVRERVLAEIHSRLQLPGSELVHGAGGIAEGVPAHLADATLPKFRPDGILLVHAGGGAGLFSTIIGGWANGSTGSHPVTRKVTP